MLSRSGWLWLNFVIIPASCNHFLENIIHREKNVIWGLGKANDVLNM